MSTCLGVWKANGTDAIAKLVGRLLRRLCGEARPAVAGCGKGFSSRRFDSLSVNPVGSPCQGQRPRVSTLEL